MFSTKRTFIFLVFLISYMHSYANMASPYRKGTNTSEAYSSRHIDILHEQIKITHINPYQAKFTVIYTIKSDRAGQTIPLIFDTMTKHYNNNEEFKVWVDDKEVPIYDIPSTYENENALQWIDSLNHHISYSLDDVPDLIGLKYFEVNLSEGIHNIKVEYIALAGLNLASSVKEFCYSYNLEPARHWRSFGTLDIEIDTTPLKGTYKINFTGTDTIPQGAISHWHFSELPSQDVFTISFAPQISKFGRMVDKIGPGDLTLIFSSLLIILHIWGILRYRKNYPDERYSLVVIIGSIFLPIIFCIIFMISFYLTDWAIGEFASERHGYTFLIFFIYPIVMPIYWIIMWLIDRFKKRKLHSQ